MPLAVTLRLTAGIVPHQLATTVVRYGILIIADPVAFLIKVKLHRSFNDVVLYKDLFAYGNANCKQITLKKAHIANLTEEKHDPDK